MRRFLLYFYALLALLLAVFLIQNAEPVTLTFLFWDFPARRAFLVLSILLIGLFIGWTLAKLGQRRNRKAIEAQAATPPPAEQGSKQESDS